MIKLSDKSVKELRQMVKAHGVSGYSKLRKDQLIDILNELSGIGVSYKDAMLIEQFREICTIHNKRACRITRPNGTYLYHIYK